MISYIKDDITNSDCNYICHQVNCQGKMNSGVAKAIRTKWPITYDNYIKKCDEREYAIYNMCGGLEVQPNWSETLLGEIQICALYDDYNKTDKHQHVVNLFAQEAYGYDGKRYTSYDAFWQCLNNLKQCIQENVTLAFPYKIGCVRGGANWEIIRAMIREVFKDRQVYFYYLNEEDLDDEAKLNILADKFIGGII